MKFITLLKIPCDGFVFLLLGPLLGRRVDLHCSVEAVLAGWGAGGCVCWVCFLRLGPQPGKEGVGGGGKTGLGQTMK